MINHSGMICIKYEPGWLPIIHLIHSIISRLSQCWECIKILLLRMWLLVSSWLLVVIIRWWLLLRWLHDYTDPQQWDTEEFHNWDNNMITMSLFMLENSEKMVQIQLMMMMMMIRVFHPGSSVTMVIKIQIWFLHSLYLMTRIISTMSWVGIRND